MTTETQTEATESSGGDDSIRSSLQQSLSQSSPAPEAKPETPSAEPSTAQERPSTGRDEKGRFATKAAEAQPKPEKPATTPTEPAKAPKEAEPSPAAPQPRSPPQSIPAALREDWGKLSEAGQEAYLKREGEIARAFTATAEARKFHAGVSEAMKVFQGQLPAEPLAIAQNAVHTAAILHRGTPEQKAHVVASILGQFGVDVDMVNAAMQGQASQPTTSPQPQQFRDPRVDQLLAREERSTKAMAASAVTAFASSGKAPHLDKLGPMMARRMEMAADEGVVMTLDQAYDECVWSHPETRAELLKQQTAQQRETANAATQRAMHAASSVKSNPAPPAADVEPEGIRELLAKNLRRSA